MRSSSSEAIAEAGPGGGVPAEPAVRRLAVDEADAGTRLDKWLAGQPGIASREMARHLIRDGAVRLNAASAEPDTRVRAADRVEVAVPPPRPSRLIPEALPIPVLYEDEHLIVVDKPPGVPAHPGPGHPRGTLVHFLLAHCAHLSGIGGTVRPGIVHRLDKDTSGVLVAAKNDAAHQGLQAQFKAHTIERAYLALVVGHPRARRGTVDAPLGREPQHRRKQTVRPDGRHAVTHWHLERQLGPFALLRCELETGRTHQIRTHLAHRNWPVVGDPLYGRNRFRGLDLPAPVAEALAAFKRQALHAASLGFRHPITDEWLRFESPPPADFAALLALLEAQYGGAR